jgi:hypothetical protein
LPDFVASFDREVGGPESNLRLRRGDHLPGSLLCGVSGQIFHSRFFTFA